MYLLFPLNKLKVAVCTKLSLLKALTYILCSAQKKSLSQTYLHNTVALGVVDCYGHSDADGDERLHPIKRMWIRGKVLLILRR